MGCAILLKYVVVPGILLKPAWDFVYRAKFTSKPDSNGGLLHWRGTTHNY